METGLEGKPWYMGLAIGLVIGAVALFAAYKGKFEGMQAEIVRQESKLRDLQEQISRGEAAKAQLPEFRERVRRLELDLEKLLRILPNRRNVHEFLRQVVALAEREDFALTQFSPQQEIEHEFFSEWPIRVNVSGTYHNLARFFDRMSRFSRIVNVDELNITSLNNSERQTIKANFVAKTFVYKESVPPAEPAAGGNAGGKGRRSGNKGRGGKK